MSKTNFANEIFPDIQRVEERLRSMANQVKEQFEVREKHLNVSVIQNSTNKTKRIKEFFNSCGFKSENDLYEGVYVFAERKNGQWNYLYTGITRNAIQRLRDHVCAGDKLTASWAYLMVRYGKDENLIARINDLHNQKTTEANKEKKSKLNLDIIKAIGEIQSSEMSKYEVTFVPIKNDYFTLHMAEVFIACELHCKWNSFKTH